MVIIVAAVITAGGTLGAASVAAYFGWKSHRATLNARDQMVDDHGTVLEAITEGFAANSEEHSVIFTRLDVDKEDIDRLEDRLDRHVDRDD